MMAEKGVGALLVLDGAALAGIVTERDYARKIALQGRNSSSTLVGDVMTSKVHCVLPRQTSGECMALMTTHRIRHLPVMDENRQLVGVLSNDRKQRVLAKADPFTIQQLEHVEAKVFHLGSLLSDDFSPEVIAFLAKKGKVSIDVQGYLREVRDEKVYATDWKDKLQVLKNTYYLKVNETEMETITGLKEPREAAKLIHSWGVTEVIITLGSEGSLVYVDDTFYEIPAYPPHEVVDATGCGDTYSAGYLYKRLQGATPTEAGKFAAAMCTIKLEHNGPFNRSIQDVERIMK